MSSSKEPPCHLVIIFTLRNYFYISFILTLSCGKFRWEPATRLFERSFAPILNSDKRFARQHCYEIIHQSFPWLQSIQV